MRAHRIFVAALVALLLILSQSVASALPRLLVLQAEEQRTRPSLVEALRFQLRDATEVEVSAQPLPLAPAAQRIARAAATVSASQASFAVWLEAVPELQGAPGFLLYVVGGGSGRAVVEVVRLPAAKDGPDVDRSLALKVSEIVDSALRSAEPDVARALRPAPPRPAPTASVSARPASNVRAGSLGLLLGGVAASPAGNAGAQVGFRLGVGYALRTSALELEWSVSGRLLSPLDIRRDNRRAKIGEQVLGADFGVHTRGRLALGGEVGSALRWLHADGFVGNIETHSSVLVVPVLRLGPELRARLTEQVTLSLAAGGEWMPLQQRFSLAGAPLADLGRVRADALISLIISLR